MSNKREELSDRFLDFAVLIIKITAKLPNTTVGNHIKGQLSGACRKTRLDLVMSARQLHCTKGLRRRCHRIVGEVLTKQGAVCRHNPQDRVRLLRISSLSGPRCSAGATTSALLPWSACKRIPARRVRFSDRLLGSGTSSGSNYEEACGAESRKDFRHKLGVVLKELRESRFWLRLIHRCSIISAAEVEPVLKECEELCAITGKSIVTSKSRR